MEESIPAEDSPLISPTLVISVRNPETLEFQYLLSASISKVLAVISLESWFPGSLLLDFGCIEAENSSEPILQFPVSNQDDEFLSPAKKTMISVKNLTRKFRKPRDGEFSESTWDNSALDDSDPMDIQGSFLP